MPVVVALIDDLLFLSRVREAAKGSGAEVKAVRSADALLEACRARPEEALVVADLDTPRLKAVEAVRALRSDAALASIPVVGFLSHVHADLAREAREAGATRVLARSAFVQELPELIGRRGG
jgi:CheY-like chemotaxis protein